MVGSWQEAREGQRWEEVNEPFKIRTIHRGGREYEIRGPGVWNGDRSGDEGWCGITEVIRAPVSKATSVAAVYDKETDEKVVTQSEKRFLSRQIFSRLTSADASMPFVDRGNLKVSYDKETDEIILSEG